MTDLYELTALELAERIESRALSPVEVIRAVQRRLDETEPLLNAFISRTDERAARAAARPSRWPLARCRSRWGPTRPARCACRPR